MIDKIGHYSLTSPASVYDEEALTALELAGRTAAKVNECVDAQNELRTETEQHLEQQDNRITVMNDETMPEKVKQEFARNLGNGTFENMVDTYAGELTDRLDNLAQTIEPGSTSGDAELIDARVDIFGGTWDNAGSSSRAQANHLHQMISDSVRAELAEVSLNLKYGYYDYSGVFHENGEGHYHQCAEIAVNPGEIYYLSCHYGKAFPDAIGVKSDGTVKVYHESAETAENNLDKPCYIDGNMTHLRVNTVSHYPLNVYKVASFSPVIGWECVTDLVNMISQNNPVVEDLGLTVNESYFLQGWDYKETPLTNANAKYKTTGTNVKPGEIYHISASCGTVGNHYYVIYGANNKPIAYETCEDNSVTVYKTLIMPEGAANMKVSGYNVNPVIGKVKGIKDGKNLSHIKWVCLGDSLTESNQRTDMNYHDYVHEKTGVQVVNMGLSGSGYIRRSDEGYAFYQRAANIPTDADVVTIFGSGNDLSYTLGSPTDSGTSTICGCINATIDQIYAVNPTVQLGIVAPTPWINNMPSDNGSMTRYCEALEEICKRRSIPYLDLFHGSGLRPNDSTFRSLAYSKDDGNGVHPDETGHKMISGRFLTFLESLIATY